MTYVEVEVELHSFLSEALECGKWSTALARPLYTQSISPPPLFTQHAFSNMLGASHSRFRRSRDDKSTLPPPAIEPRLVRRPARSLCAYID